MGYDCIDVFPVGVNPPRQKKEIMQVSGGDSIVFRDYVLTHDGIPVTPDNCIASFCLRDQKFSEEPIWTGGWFDGIELENKKPGHVLVRVPDIVSWSLRRGSFVYSLLIADKFGNNRRTHMRGSILVEYEATSPQLSIPYKDGADPTQSYQHVSNDPKYVTGIHLADELYRPDSAGVVYLPGIPGSGGEDTTHSCILPCDGKWYKLCLKLVDGNLVSYWVETSESAVPVSAVLDGVTYTLRLTKIDGVLTSYWERVQ